MSVEWTWYNEQRTIIRFTFCEPWTLDDYIMAVTDATQAVTEREEIVHAIMDLAQIGSIPPNLISGMFTMARRLESIPQIGTCVAIYVHPLVATLLRSFQRLVSPDSLVIGEDYADAERIFAQLRTQRL